MIPAGEIMRNKILLALGILFSTGLHSAQAFEDAIIRIGVGEQITCANTTNNTRCWGRNPDQLSSEPGDLLAVGNAHYCISGKSGVKCGGQRMTAPPSNLTDVYELRAMGNHTCALSAKGIQCWGSGWNTVSFPANPKDPFYSFVFGDAFFCFMKKSGVTCTDAFGKTYRGIPSKIAPALQLVAGNDHVCALTLNREVKCWGSAATDVPPNLKDVNFLASGGSCVCASSAKGVECWGSRRYACRPPSDLRDVLSMSIGAEHGCAVTRLGTRCWGGSYYKEAEIPAELF